ncbi:unnamed protein product [Blepharisma stoltei]|uniref:Plasmodium RESA N-terminal domain-containing protein n=1 Tax=Blepharisma stoltei TaxID=1481888 RepID=A0AAU9K9B7_9CILI|nr:unnamed protein product [Blepharisma stoltei]
MISLKNICSCLFSPEPAQDPDISSEYSRVHMNPESIRSNFSNSNYIEEEKSSIGIINHEEIKAEIIEKEEEEEREEAGQDKNTPNSDEFEETEKTPDYWKSDQRNEDALLKYNRPLIEAVKKYKDIELNYLSEMELDHIASEIFTYYKYTLQRKFEEKLFENERNFVYEHMSKNSRKFRKAMKKQFNTLVQYKDFDRDLQNNIVNSKMLYEVPQRYK